MALDSDKYLMSFYDAHGSRYSYVESVFGNSESKITVICRTHGRFPIIPRSHAKGHGCPECGKISRARSKRNNSSKSFVSRSRAAHGDKYDYSKSEYRKAHSPLTISCKEHGDFEQRPISHWRGVGCPKCGGSGKLSPDEFSDRAKEKHGGKYNYSEVTYVNLRTKVSILCNTHGSFM